MTSDSPKHHRHSVRLPGYDYAKAGAYFVTLCTQGRELFFDLPELRAIAESCWLAIPDHHSLVALDAWVVMPNHLHGVLFLNAEPPDAGRGVLINAPARRDPTKPYSAISPHRHTLSVIIRTYKAAVTLACRKINHPKFAWQRNYHEHIIRTPSELQTIRRYIQNNPLQWALDRDHPQNNPKKTETDYWAEIMTKE